VSCINCAQEGPVDVEHEPTDLAVGSSTRYLHPLPSS